MLYDILSPLIFFASLGGILLIIGRVVIRIRREQVMASLRSAAAPSIASPGVSLWQPAGREVTQLLKPTQKSVHAMRSRFAFILHMLRQTKETLTGWWARWQSHRRADSARPGAMPSTTTASPTAPPAAPIVAPPATRGQRERLAFWRRWRPAGAAVTVPRPAKPADNALPVTEARHAAETPRTEEQPPAAQAPEPAPVTLVKTPAGVVASVAQSRSFTKSLLRRVQAQRVSKEPPELQSAAAELAAQHFQAAEDVLVPYIVKHPKDTAAYVLLGQAAMGREAWEEAMEIFEQVIKWNRRQAGAYAGLGLSAYRAGRFTRALQALQRAQDADPANREVLNALLSIAEKMDNPALQHSIREKIVQLKEASNSPQDVHHGVSV